MEANLTGDKYIETDSVVLAVVCPDNRDLSARVGKHVVSKGKQFDWSFHSFSC